MGRNMKKTKMTKLTKISPSSTEKKKTLLYNDNIVKEKGFSFCFARFDRNHELFNLSSDTCKTDACWFLDLFDCLKEVNGRTIPELRQSSFKLHPIDWSKTNARAPDDSNQIEYWQFRLNKSKGRVIGYIIDSIFYVVWLDRYHNLTNSNGYGTAVYYEYPHSEYEKNVEMIEGLRSKVTELEKENKELYESL